MPAESNQTLQCLSLARPIGSPKTPTSSQVLREVVQARERRGKKWSEREEGKKEKHETNQVGRIRAPSRARREVGCGGFGLGRRFETNGPSNGVPVSFALCPLLLHCRSLLGLWFGPFLKGNPWPGRTSCGRTLISSHAKLRLGRDRQGMTPLRQSLSEAGSYHDGTADGFVVWSHGRPAHLPRNQIRGCLCHMSPIWHQFAID